MTEQNSNSGSTGIGFFGLLTIVFIVLKLTKVIDWSWWWVTAPAWGSAILWFILVIVGIFLSVWANKK